MTRGYAGWLFLKKSDGAYFLFLPYPTNCLAQCSTWVNASCSRPVRVYGIMMG